MKKFSGIREVARNHLETDKVGGQMMGDLSGCTANTELCEIRTSRS